MRVLLTGGAGMVGQSILRRASQVAPDWKIDAPSSRELDLRDAGALAVWFKTHSCDLIVHAAAKVGGIKANIANPEGFLYENMLIGMTIVRAAREAGVQKLIFLGSSCMYPKDFGTDLKEEDMLAAPLEPTNEGYALAKIATTRLCTYATHQYGVQYKTVVPCNLYGVGDHFDAARGHMIAAATLKIVEAMEQGRDKVEIWGDGMARREFMYVDDLADFILTYGAQPEKLPDMINVGLGRDYTVNEYYRQIADTLGFKGSFVHNLDAPVGMMKKLMDSSRAQALGWRPQIDLAAGVARTVNWYLSARKEAAQ